MLVYLLNLYVKYGGTKIIGDYFSLYGRQCASDCPESSCGTDCYY